MIGCKCVDDTLNKKSVLLRNVFNTKFPQHDSTSKTQLPR